MTAATIARPSLRAVILDGLEDAFYARRAVIEGCGDCARNAAGICGDHQADNDAAFEYDEARKQLERNPGHPDVLAVFCGIEEAQAS